VRSYPTISPTWSMPVLAEGEAMGENSLARVYDPQPSGGRVFLVERLRPRGLRRDAIRFDAWLKEAAPSTALRQ